MTGPGEPRNEVTIFLNFDQYSRPTIFTYGGSYPVFMRSIPYVCAVFSFMHAGVLVEYVYVNRVCVGQKVSFLLPRNMWRTPEKLLPRNMFLLGVFLIGVTCCISVCDLCVCVSLYFVCMRDFT